MKRNRSPTSKYATLRSPFILRLLSVHSPFGLRSSSVMAPFGLRSGIGEQWDTYRLYIGTDTER